MAQHPPRAIASIPASCAMSNDRHRRRRAAFACAATMLITAGASARVVDAHASQASRAIRPGATHTPEFQRYIARFGKRYCDSGDAKRACTNSLEREKIYLENMAMNARHNANEARTYSRGETKWSDLTPDDFTRTRLTYSPRGRRVDEAMLGALSRDMPALVSNKASVSDVANLATAQESFMSIKNFSWRQPPEGYGNVVGRVHDQENMCASCWAFVTADSIASRVAVITKKDAPELSVKQLMACDTADHACSTGNMYTAYEWLGESGGISTKSDYDKVVPGEREDDPEASCAANVSKKYTTPAMCDLKQTAGEPALMAALYNRGPVAVGINANLLMQYSDGIIMADDCPPLGEGIYSINHAALIVGWGEDDSGIKYWELKNSYGEEWGDHGFFRLQRGEINDRLFGTCGLLFESVFPIVVEPGSPLTEDTSCTPGSVMKTSYYREESDNPGIGAYGASSGDVRRAKKLEYVEGSRASTRNAADFEMAQLGTVSQSARATHAVYVSSIVGAFAAFAIVASVAVVAVRHNTMGAHQSEREGLLVGV